MNWGMEILLPNPYVSSLTWVAEDSSRSTMWTAEENKAFEYALTLFDEKMPDRWQKVAAMVPGKTVDDVKRQYKELEDDVSSIEAGLYPVPGYSNTSSLCMLEWGSSGHRYNGGIKTPYSCRKSSVAATARPADHERKKGIPWTEDEHKLFLMGLKKYGKGDWRNISRNFVISRTPTQVASHAQKYFIRQLNGGKDKRRASIHDITTLSLEQEAKTPTESTKKSPSPEQSPVQKLPYHWSQSNNEPFGSQGEGGIFGSIPFEASSYWQHLQGEAAEESLVAAQNMLLMMQTGFQYPAHERGSFYCKEEAHHFDFA